MVVQNEMNSYLHAFHEKDFILPDKHKYKKQTAVHAKKSTHKPVRVELKLELEDDLLLSINNN